MKHTIFARSGMFAAVASALCLAALCSCVQDRFATSALPSNRTANGVRIDGAVPGEWTHDWDAATAAAKEDGKPVFVNFTGSDWCFWCDLLKRRVFMQPEWIAWAGTNVYLVHIDFPNGTRLVPAKYRKRNRELAERYEVRGYPTCYLLDPATLEPLERFGASRDITASAFIEAVADAMPGAEEDAEEAGGFVNGVRVDGAAPGEWTHDWDAAFAAAKADGKPVFVNFTGSDWCDWCEVLQHQVFDQPEWGAWAATNVYLVHIDRPQARKLVPAKYRFRNKELMRRYRIEGVPTCYLFDPATHEPLGQFGVSPDTTAAAFIEKVAAAMSGAEEAEAAAGSGPDVSGDRPEEDAEGGGPMAPPQGGLPVGALPSEGRIAWFDFAEGNEDKACPGRSFDCLNAPVSGGTMHFNGNYVHFVRTNGCNAELRVPELDREGFTVCLSFRPECRPGKPLPLLNFGKASRWFYAHLEADGRLRFGLNCHDIRLDTEGRVADGEWNWFVCSVDIAGKVLRCVLNGVRLDDILLPEDFAYRAPEGELERLLTVDTTYWNAGSAFRGDIAAFLLYDHPFGDEAFAPLCGAAGGEKAEEAEGSAPGAVEEEAVAFVNGIRVDGAEPGEWTHDWDAAVAAAKKDGKPVFVNFTGSDWCGWCKLLKNRVFTQPEWTAWASRNVYLVHLDFPSNKELVPEKYRGRNQELANRYKVEGYPTCYLLDPATLAPLGQFGASRDVTAAGFVGKVSAAMPGAAKAGATDGSPDTPVRW